MIHPKTPPTTPRTLFWHINSAVPKWNNSKKMLKFCNVSDIAQYGPKSEIFVDVIYSCLKIVFSEKCLMRPWFIWRLYFSENMVDTTNVIRNIILRYINVSVPKRKWKLWNHEVQPRDTWEICIQSTPQMFCMNISVKLKMLGFIHIPDISGGN